MVPPENTTSLASPAFSRNMRPVWLVYRLGLLELLPLVQTEFVGLAASSPFS